MAQHKLKAIDCTYGLPNKSVALCDGGNLYFIRKVSGTASWSYRYTGPRKPDGTKGQNTGLPRSFSIGSANDVSLKRARQRVQELRALVADGIDPLDARTAAQEAQAAEIAQLAHTFQTMVADYIAAKGPEWKSARHRDQWSSALQTHAYKRNGTKLVGDITTKDVQPS